MPLCSGEAQLLSALLLLLMIADLFADEALGPVSLVESLRVRTKRLVLFVEILFSTFIYSCIGKLPKSQWIHGMSFRKNNKRLIIYFV